MIPLKCLVFVAVTFQLSWGQEVNSPAPATAPPPPVGDYLRVGMCIPKGDPSQIKDDFCMCGKNVVSCDFSKFDSKNKTSAELRAFFPQDTINRICICNAPKNLQIIVAEGFLSNYWNVARVDFYNLGGPLIIDRAFNVFFAGDIYMSKVNLLRTMFSWEYGRGRDHERFNTDAKKDPTVLQCCSQIKTPKFAAPTFYMEETTVNGMEAAALNNQHLWNNIIFNTVTFNNMDSYAIVLNGERENASFTNCHFHNMNRTGIATNDFSNLVLAHNTFHDTCHRMPIGVRSVGSESVLALMQNRFDSPVELEVDAEKVAIWFNSFSSWDAQTFINLNKTVHGDRQVSIEFNTVDRFDLKAEDIRPLQSYDNQVVFNENLILPCDCSMISKLQLPKLLQNYTQRCFSESGGRKDPCHLKMVQVKDECTKTNGKPIYALLCSKDENNFKSFAYSKTIKEIEPFLKRVAFPIKSEFINDMLRHVKSPFKPTKPMGVEEGKTLPKNANSPITERLGFHILLLFTIALFVLK